MENESIEVEISDFAAKHTEEGELNWLIHFFIRKSDSLPFCAGLMMTCSGIKKVDVSLFKVTNWNNRTMSKICSKLKTPQHLHLHRSGAPGVNFKHIPHIWFWASKYWLGNIRLPIKIFFHKKWKLVHEGI